MSSLRPPELARVGKALQDDMRKISNANMRSARLRRPSVMGRKSSLKRDTHPIIYEDEEDEEALEDLEDGLEEIIEEEEQEEESKNDHEENEDEVEKSPETRVPDGKKRRVSVAMPAELEPDQTARKHFSRRVSRVTMASPRRASTCSVHSCSHGLPDLMESENESGDSDYDADYSPEILQPRKQSLAAQRRMSSVDQPHRAGQRRFSRRASAVTAPSTRRASACSIRSHFRTSFSNPGASFTFSDLEASHNDQNWGKRRITPSCAGRNRSMSTMVPAAAKPEFEAKRETFQRQRSRSVMSVRQAEEQGKDK